MLRVTEHADISVARTVCSDSNRLLDVLAIGGCNCALREVLTRSRPQSFYITEERLRFFGGGGHTSDSICYCAAKRPATLLTHALWAEQTFKARRYMLCKAANNVLYSQ